MREYEFYLSIYFFRVPQSNSGINSNKAESMPANMFFVLDPLFETGSFAR